MTAHYVVHGKVGYSGGLVFAHEAEAIAEAEKAAKDEWIGPIWVEKTEVIWTNSKPKHVEFPPDSAGNIKWSKEQFDPLIWSSSRHKYTKEIKSGYCYCGRGENHELHR